MTNLTVGNFNTWCTGDNGKEYRIVSIAGKWRLCVKSPRPGEWLFVNAIEYPTRHAALVEVDLQP